MLAESMDPIVDNATTTNRWSVKAGLLARE